MECRGVRVARDVLVLLSETEVSRVWSEASQYYS